MTDFFNLQKPIEVSGMAAMHKLVYKMYMDKIEEMEKDKEEMSKLTEMLTNPNEEFPEDEEDQEGTGNEPEDGGEVLIENEVAKETPMET